MLSDNELEIIAAMYPPDPHPESQAWTAEQLEGVCRISHPHCTIHRLIDEIHRLKRHTQGHSRLEPVSDIVPGPVPVVRELIE